MLKGIRGVRTTNNRVPAFGLYTDNLREEKEKNMKKVTVLLALVFCVLLVSCNTSTNVKNDAFPSEYKTLEFWNGGGCIARYENVLMEVTMMQSSTLTNAIRFYKYHVYSEKQRIDEFIIDSEALSLKYVLPENKSF